MSLFVLQIFLLFSLIQPLLSQHAFRIYILGTTVRDFQARIQKKSWAFQQLSASTSSTFPTQISVSPEALSYPIHYALIAFGWAMEPFEPDAADLYLSAGLKW
ncbi:hypothetical protein F5Y08DRAFT_347766 [Xylaria arbuscula]|nr:hypothetical protein F5Y08DRAFT_347766 [Xylaria arbuscula]